MISPLRAPRSVMILRDYEVGLHLGCSAEEKFFLQPVLVTVEFEFQKSPQGEHSDSLLETTDYVALTEAISSVAKKKPYNLIEHFCREVWGRLRHDIQSQGFEGRLRVQATKVRVPVINLRSGVTWICEDDL